MSDFEPGPAPQDVSILQTEDDENRNVVCLSPRPLPTGFPAYRSPRLALQKGSDVYLDFISKVRAPEKAIRSCMSVVLTLMVLFLSSIIFLDISAILTEDRPAFEIFRLLLADGRLILSGATLMACALAGSIVWSIWTSTRPYPVRFNRQKREMAYINDADQPPYFIPWEDVLAFVRTTEMYTHSGPHNLYALNLCLCAKDDDEVNVLLSFHSSLEMAIGEWESIRVFMEKGPKFLPDTNVLDEIPTDALELFHMQRQLYQESHGYLRYLLGFVLPNLLSGWTLAFHIAQWIKKLPRSDHSTEMEEWSQSIPFKSWKRPDPWCRYEAWKMSKFFEAGGTLEEYQREAESELLLDATGIDD